MPPPSSTAATVRPWTSFLSSFSLPLSIAELSLRFHSNIYTFRYNYVILSLLIFIATLIYRPVTAIVFVLVIFAWIYFLVGRDEPIVLFDYEIGDRTVVIVLSVVTIVAVAVAGVWWKLFVSIVISALVVSLHAILMRSDGAEESPYGALLAEEDGGGYVPV